MVSKLGGNRIVLNGNRWISASPSDYQQAIDRLEGVAVAHLFELEKANQASTGKPAAFYVGTPSDRFQVKYKILDKPWSKRVAREASAAYFKLERSHEELRRLDAEVERWLAYTRSHFNKVEEVLSTL